MTNLSIFIFRLIPKSLISRVFGYVARIKFHSILLHFIFKRYCKLYNVKTDEILYPQDGFKSIDEFFTRKLKDGVHVINSGKDSIVSPVDARVDQFGDIGNDSIIQAKGINYSVADLVPSDMSDEFINGSFITLYLSPADYHRIHSPVSGIIFGFYSIPGKLYTVKEFMVNGLTGLFVKNERLVTYIRNDNGLVAVCKIGAMNVGRITLSYSNIETNKTLRKRKEFFYPENKQPAISRGDELGIFHMGSTVILLFQKDTVGLKNINIGTRVRVGEKIGVYL